MQLKETTNTRYIKKWIQIPSMLIGALANPTLPSVPTLNATSTIPAPLSATIFFSAASVGSSTNTHGLTSPGTAIGASSGSLVVPNTLTGCVSIMDEYSSTYLSTFALGTSTVNCAIPSTPLGWFVPSISTLSFLSVTS